MAQPASFLDHLAQDWPPAHWQDVTVLIAISGGADSVALARGLHSLQPTAGDGRLILAHFNHRLRGPASDADESFVQSLAAQLNLPCRIGRATADLAATANDGLEAAARDARYEFLSATAGECGARYLVTAHTADDPAETVRFNILRGTGLAGLAGIPRIRPLTPATTILRPLLDITRAEVISYLASLGQPFCADESNQSFDFTRNRIRLQLLPLLERDFNPRVKSALLRLAQTADQADSFLQQQAETVLYTAARPIPSGVELDLKRLAHLHPTLIRHALTLIWHDQSWPLQDMSFDKWELLVTLCQAGHNNPPHPSTTLPGSVRAEIQSQALRLTRVPFV
jgi:tRNA(Ile)-lysidine synthase